MARLPALDASFLRLETPSAHMHVGWLAHLDGPLDPAALCARLEQKLPLAERFTQKLRPAPIALGFVEPSWVDDPSFALRDHVRVLEPGVDVAEACARFLGRQLPRDRPLWEIEIVPETSGGGAALLGKVHHAMVDGLAAVELGMMLFDAEPHPAPLPATVAVAPQVAPSRGPVDSAVEQFQRAGAAARMGLSTGLRGLAPQSGLRVADSVRRAAFAFAEDALSPAPSSYLNGTLGPERVLICAQLDLERLMAVRSLARASFNDVVLAVVAGALRRLAAIAEEECRPLRAMIPVSVRDAAAAAEGGGNRITFGFVELPLDEPAAVRRLTRVQEQTRRLKTGGRIEGSELLLKALAGTPGAVKGRAARLMASPRLYNLVVSNVPGPRFDLYAGGARVRAIHPVIPLSDAHLLSVGVLTYGGGAHFGFYADPTAVPEEVSELPALLEGSLVALEGALMLRPRRRGAARTRGRPAQRAAPTDA